MGESTIDIITSSHSYLDERESIKAKLSVAILHLTEYKLFKSMISKKSNCCIISGGGLLPLKKVCIKLRETALQEMQALAS